MTSIGIIGCGYWGPNLVRNFHGLPGTRVHTVSDLRSGRLAFIEENYPDIATTANHLDIIDNPEIDAVVIATPVTTHREIAEQAMRAGKHVFVEKPMAHTSVDAWAMVEIAKSTDRVLAVGHIFQFTPGVRRIRQEVRAGRLGKVHHLASTRINLGPPKTTVDVVWDLAPHDLSIILFLLDEMPETVVATGSSFQWKGFVDNAHITLGFASGTTAHVHVSWLSSSKTRLVQLFGETGTIVYDEMLALDGKVKFYDRGFDSRIDAKDGDSLHLGYSTGDIHVLGLEQHEPLRMECSEFIRAIKTGDPVVNDGVIGARVVELLERVSAQIALGPALHAVANGSVGGRS